MNVSPQSVDRAGIILSIRAAISGQARCGKYTYQHGVFRCGQCNIILALTDVHEGDGPTMVIPGSHKSNFPHPNAGNYAALIAWTISMA